MKVDISIIVPIYHGKKYINSLIKQIESCKRCLKENVTVELVLSNDAPDDVLENIYRSNLIKIILLNTEKNRGIHGARVHGLEFCRGEFVVFLDQDDKIRPDYLQSQMMKIADADMIVCQAVHDNKIRYDALMPFENVASKDYMLTQGNSIVSPGQVLIRKSSISLVWKKNILTHNGADDWLLWLCMMSENRKIALNEEVLYEHVVNGSNASWQSVEMIYSEQEVMEIVEKNQVLSQNETELFKKTLLNINIKRIQLMDKYKKMFFIYDAWMDLHNEESPIAIYLREMKYYKVAIYGDGYLGKQLYKELKRGELEVCYYIDRNANFLEEEIPVYLPDSVLPKVDAVIITLAQQEKAVAAFLSEKLDAKIYFINELIEEIKCQKYQ